MFRAVGNLCAVDFNEMKLPVSAEEAKQMLAKIGFRETKSSLTGIAESVVGKEYRRAARLSEAPDVFDCSSLTKWLYGQLGIWIPRRSIQQFSIGTSATTEEAKLGDLIFTKGFKSYYENDLSLGIGHVGMILNKSSVIEAASKTLGVIRSPISEFTEAEGYRGIRRIVPNLSLVTTFQTPAKREIESSDDIKWIIYQNLP